MSGQVRISIVLVVVALTVSNSYGQFAGGAFFSTAPTSQLGPVTNNLVLTNTVNGFTVTGQVLIACPVAPPQDSGTLVNWTVDRPLATSFAFAGWTTSTTLTGFSTPPPGAAASTSGSVTTRFTEPTMASPSTSLLPLTLTNGAATWTALSNTSGIFSGSTPASPTYNLRQTFQLDGIYQSGPGGNWVVDVPLQSFITQVPEPGTAGMLSAIAFGFIARRGRPRR